MTFTETLTALLACFNSTRANAIAASARTFNGVGQRVIMLRPPFQGPPIQLVDLLLDDWSVRLPVVMADLPVAIVRWRPRTRFDRSTRWRHAVDPDAQQAIAAALATMPPPTILVDAGPEPWAGWRLDTPIVGRDRIEHVLMRLAEQLGANTGAPRDTSVPIGGAIRNWTNNPREYLRIMEADPTRVYHLNDLIEENIHDADTRSNRTATETMGHGASARGRRSTRSAGARNSVT